MLEYKTEDNKLYCCFSGRIDTKASLELEDELLDKLQHTDLQVVFDFSGLEYIASSFLRVCVKAVRVLHSGNSITVKNVSSEILHILEMTGFDKLMKIERGAK